MPQRISFATFNVRNLVTPGVTYYGNKRYSDNAFRTKVIWLAEQLYRMDADVVGLQEVFHAEPLGAVVAAYHALLDNRERPSAAQRKRYTVVTHVPNVRSTPEDPSPGLALLSRLPVVGEVQAHQHLSDPIEVAAHEGLTFRLDEISRPVMVARVQLNEAQAATVVVAHLKSKRPEYLGDDPPEQDETNALFLERAFGSFRSLLRRAGESLALRRLLLEMMRGSDEPVVVLGDFNDALDAVTSDIVRGEMPWRGWDIASKQRFWDVQLHSAARIHIRRSERQEFFTHVYNGTFSTLDHILVSQELYYRNPDRLGDVDIVRCFNDHLTDDSLPGARHDADVSDHGQMVAVVQLYEPRTD